MDPGDIKSRISYYCREQFYNQMLLVCREALIKIKDDSTINLCHALALALCNRLQESIDLLETFRSDEETKLAAVVALLYTHKMKRTTDKEVFFKLDAQMREFRKNADGSQLYNVALVLFAYKKYQKALDYVEKSLGLEPNKAEALLLKGWVLIHLGKSGEKDVANIFEGLQRANFNCLDVSFGLALCFAGESKYTDALNVVNKAIVKFGGTNLAIVQKMKIQFSMRDWDQTIETMNRVLENDTKNLEALQVSTRLYSLLLFSV